MDLKDPQIPSPDEKHQCFRGFHYSPKLGSRVRIAPGSPYISATYDAHEVASWRVSGAFSARHEIH